MAFDARIKVPLIPGSKNTLMKLKNAMESIVDSWS